MSSKAPSFSSERNEFEIEMMNTFKQIGFSNATKLCNTLQGTIWKAEKMNMFGEIETSVIKIASKFLHANSSALVNDKMYHVSEDILHEKDILKYLTVDENCPHSIVKYKAFCTTKTDYWLVMEHGGSSLFDFTVKAHKLIKFGCIDICEWNKLVIIILKQMVECLHFIHSKNVTHFDISLENCLINDISLQISKNIHTKEEKIEFDFTNIQIKLCDFGLAEKFGTCNFQSNKYGGKTNYKSPEMCNKAKSFDARKNDIWAVGVCLFALLTGTMPWKKAHKSDDTFSWVMRHSISQLLICWNMQTRVNKHLLFLLESIFTDENHRINITDIKTYVNSLKCL